jgi:beta-lactamase superfamily II metal-dependent hydrolase
MLPFAGILVAAWLCCSSVVGLPLDNAAFNQRRQPIVQSGVPRIPAPDGLLHVYALPVGQGDSHVVQCPSGTLTIVDLGSSEDDTAGFWHIAELTAFFQGQYNLIRNIILTHNHYDHYSFIPTVLDPTTADMSGLQEIYISCTSTDLVADIQTWLGKLNGGASMLRLFNGGGQCGTNDIPCEPLSLCPNDPAVTVKVMSANIGQQCSVSGGNKNVDSLVFKVTHGSVSIMFNGDFEDFTSSDTEDGPQKSLVDYYGAEMHVTVYKLAHHGAENLANKPVSRDAVMPKAVFVSGNPWYSYRHPRCGITDGFINNVQPLCQPEVTDTASPLYCGPHPIDNLPIEQRVQRVYTCGLSSGLRGVTDNAYAMYSTVPDETTMNVVELVSDGTRWGFINNLLPKIRRD